MGDAYLPGSSSATHCPPITRANIAPPGAMVLAHSLRNAGTRHALAILVTLDTLAATTVEALRSVYDHLIPVDRLLNRRPANLYLMQRPDLAAAFTKIALWRQTQFRRLVYIDADAVALRAPDELLDAFSEAGFAAAPDVGWPDCFNSGVMLLTPNMGDYYALLALAERGVSFDGADQGLLNMHFRHWARLSFAYNCTPSANYQYLPAYRHFGHSISIAHFIGADKPWSVGRHGKGGEAGAYEELLGRWWAVYDRHYRAPAAQWMAGQGGRAPNVVQKYVKGEMGTSDYGYSAAPTAPEVRESRTRHGEPPFLEAREPIEGIVTRVNKGQTITPHEELRPEPKPFVPPQTQWDPSRSVLLLWSP